MGWLIVSRGGALGSVALKNAPLSKMMLSALVPIKEPPIFSWALGPKTMPLGLIKNRLALWLARIMPSIFEMLLPVIREMMLLMLAALSK